MRIGQVAEAAGVSVRALRYYEEKELLRSERTPGGQREYGQGAVERVRWIQQLYGAGLNSATVRQLLPCVYTEHATPEVLARLEAERDRLDAQVAELAATRDRLDALVTAAATSTGCTSTGAPALEGAAA